MPLGKLYALVYAHWRKLFSCIKIVADFLEYPRISEGAPRYHHRVAARIVHHAPETEEIKSLMAKHAQMLVEAKGEYSGIRQMRAHAGFYIKGIKGAAKIRARLNQSESLDELLSIIKEI